MRKGISQIRGGRRGRGHVPTTADAWITNYIESWIEADNLANTGLRLSRAPTSLQRSANEVTGVQFPVEMSICTSANRLWSCNEGGGGGFYVNLLRNRTKGAQSSHARAARVSYGEMLGCHRECNSARLPPTRHLQAKGHGFHAPPSPLQTHIVPLLAALCCSVGRRFGMGNVDDILTGMDVEGHAQCWGERGVGGVVCYSQPHGGAMTWSTSH